MTTVELIYDRECPNVSEARASLTIALEAIGWAQKWLEWERSDPASPDYVRGYASPTILIDGQDVGGPVATEASACRLYRTKAGHLAGAPPPNAILEALQRSSSPRVPVVAAGARLLPSLPAIAAALLPKLTCPLCWPAYTAVLGSLGIGFVDYTPFVLPLTASFLAVALASLGCMARKRGNAKPFLLGAAAAALVLVGKFALDSDVLMYAGLALLLLVPLLPWRKAKSEACSGCRSTE